MKISGPAKNGSIIYAANVEIMAKFYCDVFLLKIIRSVPEMTILNGDNIQLLIFKAPLDIEVQSPPQERESALKLFFTVEDIAVATNTIETLGGSVKEEVWEGPTFYVRNAVDPEGNIFHLRWVKD